MKRIICVMFFAFALSTNVVFAENDNDKISKSEISSIELNNPDNDNKVSTKLQITKKEFSAHFGVGYCCGYCFGFNQMEDIHGNLSIGAKYKYKPFEKYDIRLLGEVDMLLPFHESVPFIIPIYVGLDYAYRVDEDLSIWGDFGLGFSVPLSDNHEIGTSMFYELGIKYKNYSFSFNPVKSYNESSKSYNACYMNFRFGYHF